MSRAFLPATTTALAALALAACGSDAPEPAQSAGQPIARRLDGLYTAHIAGPQLRDVHVAAGTWSLRVDVGGRALRLIPPEGGDIALRLTALDASRLELAPDTACESRAGRTRASRFAWTRTDALLRLESVRAPCRSDATVLTLAPWRAAWPEPPLAGP